MSISRISIAMLPILFVVASCFFNEAIAGGMGGGGRGGGGRGGGGKQNVPPDAEPKKNPFAPGAAPVVGVQARLDAIEKWIDGKVTKGSMDHRAQHLERRLVPYEHNLESMDMEKRVENLWTIVAKGNANVVTTPRLNEQ